ncbi:MAG TPA: GNAT family N-acetyltransferase [Gaiellaceae bacterium]|nr:GNAT family N-acetyltransferase [Gaiellaceae bacterium]
MLRPADRQDARFLRDMLRHAYHWRMSEDAERPVYRYVRNWGRQGDAGVIAMEGPHSYGAAWYRVFTADEPGFGFVDEKTPELTIAVVPSRRGKGVGKELLEALLERAKAEGWSAVSLSTDPGQVEWYEEFGFEQLAETPHAVTMIKRF